MAHLQDCSERFLTAIDDNGEILCDVEGHRGDCCFVTRVVDGAQDELSVERFGGVEGDEIGALARDVAVHGHLLGEIGRGGGELFRAGGFDAFGVARPVEEIGRGGGGPRDGYRVDEQGHADIGVWGGG